MSTKLSAVSIAPAVSPVSAVSIAPAVSPVKASSSFCASTSGPDPAATPTNSLYQFLLGFRVEKGCDHTHTSFARPAGAFYIPASQQPQFFSLYRAALARGEDLYLTEKHRHVGPVVVDLDFRFEPSAEEAGGVAGGGGWGAGGPSATGLARRHTDAVVADIVRTYAHHVAAFVQTPGEFEVLVQEKSAPTMYKGLVKDGMHLIMPSVVTRPEVQQMVRTAALPALTEALRPMALANRMEDVVDEAVIERNNWMMYGSKKPHGEAYVVTRAYVYSPATGDLRVQPLPPCLSASEWVEPLSIRNKHDEVPVRETKQAAVSDYITQVEERRRRKEAVQAVLSSAPNARSNTCDNLDLVGRLVDILSAERADSYDEWVRVGWCLRNVDHRLLDKWIEFSKRSSKYIDGECPRFWNSMRQGGLGVGTLHMWARQDSPDAYREILRTDLKDLVLRSVSGTHHDVARVVHHMYRYEYVCASLRNRQWYEFRDHRWRESDSACSLRLRISSDVFREYSAIVAAHQMRVLTITDEVEQERLVQMCTKLNGVATQLKRVNFKENVMKECSELFYVEKFEEMLDANLYLIGFENGVYDLQRHEFREGRPDDYISNSTHINYVPFCEDHPTIREIQRFYEQVHPDKEVREYVLRSLASALSGVIREERFNIWTGCGSNGKSINVSLMEKAFGDYCCKFPVTLLTQKRAASNAATSEIARAKGKRFAVLQEPSEDERLNIGLMKELSGGDTIMARQLYREPVEFKPQFKMWLLCNQLPLVPSDDGGTWRRIRVVEFGSKFCDSPTKDNEYPIDLELPQKLEGWREHFMAMLIDYHRRFATVKLDEPEAVMACTRDYQRNNDHMADFVDSCLERVPARVGMPEDQLPVLLLDDAFAELKDWVRRDNIPFRVGKRNDIKTYLDRALGRCTPLGRGRMGWRGVRMRCIDEDEDGDALA